VHVCHVMTDFRIKGVFDPRYSGCRRNMDVVAQRLLGSDEVEVGVDLTIGSNVSVSGAGSDYLVKQLETKLSPEKKVLWYYCCADEGNDNTFLCNTMERRLTDKKEAVFVNYEFGGTTKQNNIPLNGIIFSEASLFQFINGSKGDDLVLETVLMLLKDPRPNNYKGRGLIICFVYRDMEVVLCNKLRAVGLERFYDELKKYGYPTWEKLESLPIPIRLALYRRCGMSDDEVRKFLVYLFYNV
jgi:hypothetical protein